MRTIYLVQWRTTAEPTRMNTRLRILDTFLSKTRALTAARRFKRVFPMHLVSLATYDRFNVEIVS